MDKYFLDMFRETSVYNNLRKKSFKVQLQIVYAFLKTY